MSKTAAKKKPAKAKKPEPKPKPMPSWEEFVEAAKSAFEEWMEHGYDSFQEAIINCIGDPAEFDDEDDDTDIYQVSMGWLADLCSKVYDAAIEGVNAAWYPHPDDVAAEAIQLVSKLNVEELNRIKDSVDEQLKRLQATSK